MSISQQCTLTKMEAICPGTIHFINLSLSIWAKRLSQTTKWDMLQGEDTFCSLNWKRQRIPQGPLTMKPRHSSIRKIIRSLGRNSRLILEPKRELICTFLLLRERKIKLVLDLIILSKVKNSARKSLKPTKDTLDQLKLLGYHSVQEIKFEQKTSQVLENTTLIYKSRQ